MEKDDVRKLARNQRAVDPNGVVGILILQKFP